MKNIKITFSKLFLAVSLFSTVFAQAQTWETVGVEGFSSGTSYHQSIAIDANNVPYVAYAVSITNQTAVMKYNSNSNQWENVGVDGFSTSAAGDQSLAIDSNNVPYVAFKDVANAFKTTVMKFDGSQWIALGNVGFSAGRGDFQSLAIDSNNTVYVAYRDGANLDKTTVMKFDGTNWVTVGSAGFSAGVSYYQSLAFDDLDTPYVAFKDNGNSGKSTVMKFDGTNWVTVGSAGFSAGSSSFQSMAIDNNHVLYVGYRDGGNSNKTTVMKFDGTNWVTVGSAGFSSVGSAYNRLAIDSNNTPYIAYRNDGTGTTTVMKFDGTNWVVHGNTAFSAGVSTHQSLAIDSNDVPYVAYRDEANSAKTTVKKFQSDETPPTAIAQDITVFLDASGNVTIDPLQINNNSTDNYSTSNALTYSLSQSNFDCSNVTSPVNVTLTVTDEANNQSTAVGIVTVNDNTLPTITLNGDANMTVIKGTVFNDPTVSVVDNCPTNIVVSGSVDTSTVGTYILSYKAVDGAGNESTPLTRTVLVNDLPNAVNDAVTVNQDTPILIINVLGNDSFGSDGAKSFIISGATTSQNGSIAINDANTPLDPTDDTVIYTPLAGFNGQDTFTYTIMDNDDETASATVAITVRPIVPTATDDAVSVTTNSVDNSIAVLGNDDFGGNEANATHPLTFLNGSKSSASTKGGLISVGDNGTANDLSDDVILYSAPAGFTGTDTFQYVITDADGDASTGTVTITVGGGAITSNTPTANDDTISISENSSDNVINVLANDNFGSDGAIDGGLTMTNGTLTSASTEGGAISINNQGTADTSDDRFVYTPPTDFTGTDSFQYTITDASGDADTATVTVTVTAVTDVPNAVNDSSVTVNQDTSSNVIDVLANDSFGTDGAAGFTIANTTTTAGGTISIADAGTAADVTDDTILYTPLAGYVGVDTFEYTIEDTNGDTDTATVTITVGAVVLVSGKPTAVVDAITVNADSSDNIIDVTNNDTYGADGPNVTHPLTFKNGSKSNASIKGGLISVGDNGTANDLSDDVILYSAPAGYIGTDSFQYVITDASGDADTATVTITVSAVTNVPNAVNDSSVTVNQDTSSNVIDVLANDSFGTDGAASFTIANSNTTAGGTISIADAGTVADVTDDTILYTPLAGYVGVDTFEYTIEDTNGDTDTATVTITVGAVALVNGKPTAVNDAVSVNAGSLDNIIDVLVNDDFGTDGAIDGGLTMVNGTLTSASLNGGAISIDNKGTLNTMDDEFKYTAPAGFTGTDSFQYTITDASGDASTATVTVTVSVVADAPSAVADSSTVNQNSTSNSINVLANDSFGTDGAGTLTLASAVTTAGGSVTVNYGGTLLDATDDTILYTPLAGYVGQDTFEYTLTDSNGDTDTATVTITVSAVALVNGLPTAVNDNINIVRAPNQIVVIDVLTNDIFGTDGPNLTHPLTLINGKSTEVSLAGRTITIDNNGTPLDLSDDKIKYYASNNVNVNSDSFIYTITDASGDASTGTVFITYSSLKPSGNSEASSFTLTDNNDLVAFPNPSNGRVSLVLDSSTIEASNLMIIDVLGKVVYTKKVDLKRGKNQLDFDLNLSPGTFFLQLSTATKRYKTTKLIFN